MGRLPTISGVEFCRIMRVLQYEIDYQRGSHIALRRTVSPFRRLTVPNHRELARGTLRALLKQAGLSVEEFLDLMS